MQDQVWGKEKYESASDVKDALIDLWKKSYNVIDGIPYKAASLSTEINNHFNVISNPYSLASGISFDELAVELFKQIKKNQEWAKLPTPDYVPGQKIYVSTGRWYAEERVSYTTPNFNEDGTFSHWSYSVHGLKGEYVLSETKPTAGEALKDVCRTYFNHLKGLIRGNT